MKQKASFWAFQFALVLFCSGSIIGVFAGMYYLVRGAYWFDRLAETSKAELATAWRCQSAFEGDWLNMSSSIIVAGALASAIAWAANAAVEARRAGGAMDLSLFLISLGFGVCLMLLVPFPQVLAGCIASGSPVAAWNPSTFWVFPALAASVFSLYRWILRL